MRCQYTTGATLKILSDMISLEEASSAIEGEVGKARTKESKVEHGRKVPVTATQGEVPAWMSSFLQKRGLASGTSSAMPAASSGSVEVDDVDRMDRAGDELFTNLEEAREHFEGGTRVELEEQFRVSIIGESRLLEHRGSGVHAFQARVKKGTDAERMCDAEVMHKSSRYETSAFGEHIASVLVRAWVHRMAFVLGKYLEHPPSELQHELRSYVAQEEFLACLPALHGRSKTRAESILQIGVLDADALASGKIVFNGTLTRN
eukprot:2281748-Amphidinium_carterae.1